VDEAEADVVAAVDLRAETREATMTVEEATMMSEVTETIDVVVAVDPEAATAAIAREAATVANGEEVASVANGEEVASVAAMEASEAGDTAANEATRMRGGESVRTLITTSESPQQKRQLRGRV